jgi:hypothetical protein
MWNLWSNGHLAHDLNFSAPGVYEVGVTARGTPLAGVAPHMQATLGGKALLTADPGATYHAYKAMVRVTAPGIQELRLAYANDAKSSTEDRNLILDKVDAEYVGALPTPSSGNATRVEAEDFSDHAQGRVVQDRAASGGLAVRLATNGAIAHSLELPSGAYSIRPVSKGEAQEGVQPKIRVAVDGRTVGEFSVGANYSVDWARANVAANGTHTVSLAFVNDVPPANGQDMALTIDRIAIERTGDAAAPPPPPPPPKLNATFTPKAQSNPWWVEVKVSASAPIVSVDARVNGGAWTALPKTDWGTWAKSIHAPAGSTVEFRAADAQGRTELSSPYRWGS